jgi:integrase
MSAISYEELNDLCLSYCEVLPFYGQPEQTFFQVLYDTGCRPAEAINPDLWTLTGFDRVQLQPLKGNNPRTIDLTTVSRIVQEYFNEQQTFLKSYSIGKFRFIWDKFNTYGQLTNGAKGIDLYCFRNRFVKYLHEVERLTDTDIQRTMGWTNSHLPRIYYNAEILTS